jgi:ABC-type molybdate transport system substrate-binding protein
MSAVRLLIGISVCVVIMAAGLVHAEDRKLTVFAAGSLREALGAIADDFGLATNYRSGPNSAHPAECASASSAANMWIFSLLRISVTRARS